MTSAKKIEKLGRAVLIVLLCAIKIAMYDYLYIGTYRGIMPSDYSVPQHVKRISRLVEKNYLPDHPEYTDYKVYPLYNENDEFANFCLVEFEPTGYLYVSANIYFPISFPLGLSPKMYAIASPMNYETEWRRYRLAQSPAVGKIDSPDTVWINDPDHAKYSDGDSFFFEADMDGNFITRTDSHFKAAGVTDERRYLLSSGGRFPAIKYGDYFLNLISMEAVEYNSSLRSNNNSTFIDHSAGCHHVRVYL